VALFEFWFRPVGWVARWEVVEYGLNWLPDLQARR
jgi:hypothetical protein